MTEIAVKTHEELDADWTQFRASVLEEEKDFRARFFPEAAEAELVAQKMEATEAVLRTLMSKGVGKWKLEGWNVAACRPDLAIWPIRAQLHFRHESRVGFEADVVWGRDQEDLIEWLRDNGIVLGEINIDFN